MEIQTDPVDGRMKLSDIGKLLAQSAKRKIELDKIEKEKEIEKESEEERIERGKRVKEQVKKLMESSEIYKDLNSDVIKD